jgi:flotillin
MSAPANILHDRRHMSSGGLAVSAVSALSAVVTGLVASRYKVAASNEVLVRTGIFIDDIDLCKKGFHFPFQTMSIIDLTAKSYHCNIDEAMPKERIPFNLPIVFTISPKNDTASLMNYARFMLNSSSSQLAEKVDGIIHGETRIMIAKTGINDLFSNRELFCKDIQVQINDALNPLGLYCWNVNIKVLEDMKDSKYFYYSKQRALESANNEARVNVAEQKKTGDVGEAKYSAETRSELADYEKQAKLAENNRNKEILQSDTDLSVAQSELIRRQQIAKAEADAAAEVRTLELKKEIENKRNEQIGPVFRQRFWSGKLKDEQLPLGSMRMPMLMRSKLQPMQI